MDKLTKIENRYNLHNLKSWQLLRNPYHFYIDNDNFGVSNKQTYSSKFNRVKLYITNLFVGFKNWFRSYDYIIFDTSDDYKILDNKYKSRLTQEITLNLDKSKVLHIQTLTSNFKYNGDDYIVSSAIINIMAKIISRLFRLKDYDIYEQIKIDENIKLNFKSTYQTLKARVFIIKLILKIYKPKLVFITCYSKTPELLALKKLNIKTVEIQHGISDILPYKNTNIKLQPNYIFVFGTNDKKILQKSGYIKNRDNIFVIGSYILEKTKKSNILDKYKKEYKQIVSISIQDVILEQTKLFIDSVAKELSQTLFILIPRTINIKLDNISNNIIIINNLNCLDIVINSDWHITNSSTCAFESASLGVANIFWNYQNFAKIYFKDYIESKDYNFMVDTKDELIEILNKDYTFDKSDIIDKNSDYYMNGYSQNIKNALSTINKDEDEI